MARPVLNTPMLLEAPERTVDTGGGVSIAWVRQGTVWAEITAVSARELRVGQRDSARVSHKITVRAAPIGSPQRPRPEQRLRSGARVFAIHGVAPADGQTRYLTCWAEEGAFS